MEGCVTQSNRLLWKDACYLNKRPTIMCLEKTNKLKKHTFLSLFVRAVWRQRRDRMWKVHKASAHTVQQASYFEVWISLRLLSDLPQINKEKDPLFLSPLPALLRPRRITFTSWGYCGLRFRHKPTEHAHSFLFCSCVYFCL